MKKQSHVCTVWWNPYDFMDCLAYIEVTETVGGGDTTHIISYFIHNKACKQAALKHLPIIPLHKHVY